MMPLFRRRIGQRPQRSSEQRHVLEGSLRYEGSGLQQTFAAYLWPKAAKANLSIGKLHEISLAQVLAGDTCPPLSLPDFEEFLTHCDYSIENLQFIVWYQDYCKRYNELFHCETLEPRSRRSQLRFASDRRFKKAVSRLLCLGRSQRQHRSPPIQNDNVQLLPVPSFSPTTPVTPTSSVPLVSEHTNRFSAYTVDPIPELTESIDLGLGSDGRALFLDELRGEFEGLFYKPDAVVDIACSKRRETYVSNLNCDFDKQSCITASGSATLVSSIPSRRLTALSVQTNLVPTPSMHSPLPSPGVPCSDGTRAILTELDHVLATFLVPGAKRELLLDGGLRDVTIAQVTADIKRGVASGPDVFKSVYDSIYELVENVSLRRFIAHATANINRPKQVYWYAWGVTNITFGLALGLCTLLLIPVPPQLNRLWRLFAVLWVALGCCQWYSAWRGFCSQVFLRHSTQLRAWELEEMAEDGRAYCEEVCSVVMGEVETNGRRASDKSNLDRSPVSRIAPFLEVGSTTTHRVAPEIEATLRVDNPKISLSSSANANTIHIMPVSQEIPNGLNDETGTQLSWSFRKPIVGKESSPIAQADPSFQDTSRPRSDSDSSSSSTSSSPEPNTAHPPRIHLDSNSNHSHLKIPTSFRRPPIFGPERVIEDERMLAVHRRVLIDILVFGFGIMAALAAVFLSIPGPGPKKRIDR